MGLAFGISAACLWPFHSPKNDVDWLDNGAGLQFGRYGTVMSVRPFQLPEPDEDEDRGWSIELRIEARRPDVRRHLFTIYSPNRTDVLSIRQDLNTLVVGTEGRVEENPPADKSIYVNQVFRPATPVFLSITTGARGTSLFVDGTLRKSSEVLRFSRRTLSGQMILADSSEMSDCWPGWIGELAVYNSELSPMAVSRHFAAWEGHQPPALSQDERPAALYLFNEGRGNLVHNQVPAGVDLTIPERYTVAGKPFLESPRHEYVHYRNHGTSIVLNVLGFIPFGYAWSGYLSLLSPRRKWLAFVIAAILGGALSLTMEVLQGFLPTRTSGVADIITNTAGTVLGVLAYRLSEGAMQKLLIRFYDGVRAY